MGIEILHSRKDRPGEGSADRQLPTRHDAADRNAQADTNEEYWDPGGQSRNSLSTGTGMEHPLEEQHRNIRRGTDARPEEERTGHQHLGVGSAQNIPKLVSRPSGARPSVGFCSERGSGRLSHQDQNRDSDSDHDECGQLERQIPRCWVALFPRGDDRGFDAETHHRTQNRGEEQRLQPPAPPEDFGYDRCVGQREDGGRLSGDHDEQDEDPVTANNCEHPGGGAHHHKASGHVRSASANPAAGAIAQASDQRIRQPTEESVGGESERDRQRS